MRYFAPLFILLICACNPEDSRDKKIIDEAINSFERESYGYAKQRFLEIDTNSNYYQDAKIYIQKCDSGLFFLGEEHLRNNELKSARAFFEAVGEESKYYDRAKTLTEQLTTQIEKRVLAFREIGAMEDQVTEQANKLFYNGDIRHDQANADKWATYVRDQTERRRKEILKKHGITQDQWPDILTEGVKNNW